MSRIIIIIIIIIIMKITAGESKRRKIQPSDRLRIFFWVSYDVSHEFKTRADKIFRGEISNACLNQHPRKPNFGNCRRRLGLVRRIRSVPDRSRNRESVAKAGLSPRVILVKWEFGFRFSLETLQISPKWEFLTQRAVFWKMLLLYSR